MLLSDNPSALLRLGSRDEHLDRSSNSSQIPPLRSGIPLMLAMSASLAVEVGNSLVDRTFESRDLDEAMTGKLTI